MTKRKKQAIILLALSVPMMWWGFTNFMSGTTNSTALAIGTSIGCVFGMFAALSGLTMLSTKNSLGIWNPNDKPEKKGRGEILHKSQTKVGFSPIPKDLQRDMVIQSSLATAWRAHKEPINKKPKVNKMAKADTSVDLMKREKELETRRKEVESLLAEVTKEEKAVEKELLSKGWVQKNGSWGIK